MFAISEEVQKLKEFLETAAKERPDTNVSYLEIEEATGVTMNAKGKERLRRAATYTGVEYDTVYDYGITVAGPNTGLNIIGGRLARIDSATRRAEKATKNISKRYFHNMNDGDKKTVLFLGSLFGAIRASADSYKLLASIKKPVPQLTNTQA